jgi:hypothetical protein
LSTSWSGLRSRWRRPRGRKLASSIGAAELLNMVLAVSLYGAFAPGRRPGNLTAAVRLKQREAVAAAVTAMVAP